MKKYLICLLALMFVLSGCASTQKLSAADRQNLKSIFIDPNVDKAPEMFYQGGMGSLAFLNAFGAIGGAIGGAISANNDETAQYKFKAYVEQNNMFIEKIVVEEIIIALNKSGKFVIDDSHNISSAKLNISIDAYGFKTSNSYTDDLLPVISVKCKLVDSSDKVIWSAGDRILAIHPSDIESIHATELIKNPQLIEKSWRIATKKVVANIINEL